jgi:hypothetical protein
MDVHEAPLLLHRCHWYAYVNGCVPLQVPVEAESVCPSFAVPLIAGAVTTFGGAAATFAVGLELADADPEVFEAVTARTIVEPTSPEASVYAVPVAPVMSAQFAPLESQRRHW